MQEVAYAGLLEARRRELHRAVGCALEEIHRDAPDEALELLARHFSEADEPERAVRYLLKAGDGARALYANEEALHHYGKALAFMDRTGDDAGARATLFKVGLTHHLAFDFERAGDAYRDAFSLPADKRPAPVPTEQLETAMSMVEREFLPGHAYMSNAVWLAGHIFRPLLRIDQELTVLPEVAESFNVSADGMSYGSGSARAPAGATATRSMRRTSSSPGRECGRTGSRQPPCSRTSRRHGRSTTGRSSFDCELLAATSST